MPDEPERLPGVAYPQSPSPAADARVGALELAALFAALNVHAQFTVDHTTGRCTIQLEADQATALATHLLPPEGSPEDELTIALGLLDPLTEDVRYNPCIPDRNGLCEMHGPQYQGSCAAPQAHAFLIRHGVREAR